MGLAGQSQSVHQTWTVLQHDGPDHHGTWLNPWGWQAIGVLVVAVAVYLVGFTGYNIKTQGLSGTAALPHTAFWKGIAGLV